MVVDLENNSLQNPHVLGENPVGKIELYFSLLPKLKANTCLRHKFWGNVHVIVTKVLGYDITKSCIVMYFGNMTGVVLSEHRYLFKILLAAC